MNNIQTYVKALLHSQPSPRLQIQLVPFDGLASKSNVHSFLISQVDAQNEAQGRPIPSIIEEQLIGLESESLDA